MDILPAGAVNNLGTTPTGTPQDNSTASTITSDFDMFLRLLTTQMRNQDPLNPQDSTEYTAQLATFSGVEQQVMTNDLLKELQSSLTAMNMGQLSGWIGLGARADMPVNFAGNPVTLQASPAGGADRMELMVRNSFGEVVARTPIVLDDAPFQWDGLDANGQPLPNGTYSLSAQSWRGENLIEERAAYVYDEIIEAQTLGGEVWVTMANGVSIPSDDVQGLRQPG